MSNKAPRAPANNRGPNDSIDARGTRHDELAHGLSALRRPPMRLRPTLQLLQVQLYEFFPFIQQQNDSAAQYKNDGNQDEPTFIERERENDSSTRPFHFPFFTTASSRSLCLSDDLLSSVLDVVYTLIWLAKMMLLIIG